MIGTVVPEKIDKPQSHHQKQKQQGIRLAVSKTFKILLHHFTHLCS
jgi:hypothetical protein